MPKLPPRIGDVDSKNFLQTSPLEDIDYTFSGYLLSCHLVIAHYLEEFLQSRAPDLNWSKAKLSFSQKAALFPSNMFPQGEDLIIAIKHINSLRNKLAHRVDAKPHEFDYQPLVLFLERDARTTVAQVPTLPLEILEAFTEKLSAYFIGWLASDAFRTDWRKKRVRATVRST